MKNRGGYEITPQTYMELWWKADGKGELWPCDHGHFDCAAWDNGPCVDALQEELEVDAPNYVLKRRKQCI